MPRDDPVDVSDDEFDRELKTLRGFASWPVCLGTDPGLLLG